MPHSSIQHPFDPQDPLVRKAVEISLSKGKFSTALLQTYLGKGHGYMASLAIWFESIGVIGPCNGNKPRDLRIASLEEFDALASAERVLTFHRTAESVSPGHPDKLCDQISDAILDAYLAQDPDARVAVETCGGHGIVFVVGEVTSTAASPNIEAIVRRIAGDNIKEIRVQIVEQSPEIANGVDTGGAGDQGIMIGYATDETPELLPREVVLSRKLNEYIYGKHPYDGKTQVTIAPDGTIASIVASFQNTTSAELEELVHEFIAEYQLVGTLELHLNPAGDWQQGGFDADTGLTGRKLIVDNYGPRIPIGGGAFSGKDPSKVDRSAAYMARRIAVDYLRERHAHEVLVRLAYAIGHDQPLEQTAIIDGHAEVIEGYDLTPRGIIKSLDLKRPIYAQTARYGHFGHQFTWDD